MKNQNEDLLDSKLEIIDNGNTKVYQEIALLIDKPAYLELINQIRNEYPIYGGGDPVDENSADIYSSFMGPDNDGDINLSKYKSLDKFKELLPREYGNAMIFTKNSSLVLRLQTEAVLICFEFGRPFYFVPIVLQSFVYDAVDAKFLQRTQAIVHDYDYDLTRFDEVKIPQLVIEVSPFSTDKEIRQVLKDSKKIFATDPRFKYFGKKPDTHGEIRKFRYWYWEHLTGKSYPTIADEWIVNPLAEESDSGADENVVLKGIQTYQILLEL